MAQSTVLAAGTTAASSSDIVVTTTPITVSLFTAAGGRLTSAVQCFVERKVGSVYQPTYDDRGAVFLTEGRMDAMLVAPGTYRVTRPAGFGVSVGVMTDTTA